jgi:RNA polymerase sigma factor (sigma-70 family)
VTRTDELRWLERILSELPEKYAAVVRAHALEGLSFVEVGKKLGLPPDTVRRRYDRIRDRVAERIARLRDE